MRDAIRSIVAELAIRHGKTRRVDLNDIAEVIGDRAVSYDEVDLIIRELEGRGCQVGGDPSVRELELLRNVLEVARELKNELGRRPDIDEIAASMKQPTFVVRRALENGGMLGS